MRNMIILGDRYTFTALENNRLKKQFDSIHHISYRNKVPDSSIEQLNQIIKKNRTKLIVLNTQASLSSKLLTHLTKLEVNGIHYITIEHFLERYLHKCLISPNDTNVEFLEEIHTYTRFQYVQKRLIDVFGIILLLFPTLLAIIYSFYRTNKESPGSIFFKQKRVGLREQEFTCIKLRSMHPNAEKSGAKFASKNDPRTFPWGQTIRSTKIDELIQIWNVCRGEMHLVGPRPERKIWTSEFEKVIPYYAQRHLVAPGITGLAQIKYHYGAGQLDAEQKLMYDLYYIKNWSLRLEIEVLWKTAQFVLTKKRNDLSNF